MITSWNTKSLNENQVLIFNSNYFFISLGLRHYNNAASCTWLTITHLNILIDSSSKLLPFSSSEKQKQKGKKECKAYTICQCKHNSNKSNSLRWYSSTMCNKTHLNCSFTKFLNLLQVTRLQKEGQNQDRNKMRFKHMEDKKIRRPWHEGNDQEEYLYTVS